MREIYYFLIGIDAKTNYKQDCLMCIWCDRSFLSLVVARTNSSVRKITPHRVDFVVIDGIVLGMEAT